MPSKGGLRVGFHERRSSYIVDMRTCPVLPPAISALLPRLRAHQDEVRALQDKLRKRTATIFRQDEGPVTISEDGVLDGEEVLPGFTVPLATLLA